MAVEATCEEVGGYDEAVYCTVCDKQLSREHYVVYPLGHKWGEWETIKEATEDADGEEKRECSRDNTHKETKVIPHKEHVHTLEKAEKVPENCTEDGIKEHYKCAKCGELFTDAKGRVSITEEALVIPAAGHKPGEPKRENEVVATCESAGSYEEATYCTACDREVTRYYKTVPALGHDYYEGKVTKEATCEENGLKTFTCKNDKNHTYTETIPALGHNYGDWTVTREATDLQEGEETRVCANDESHKETRPIPKKDPEAKVYIVLQEADGNWKKPTEVETEAVLEYTPKEIQYYTADYYSFG